MASSRDWTIQRRLGPEVPVGLFERRSTIRRRSSTPRLGAQRPPVGCDPLGLSGETAALLVQEAAPLVLVLAGLASERLRIGRPCLGGELRPRPRPGAARPGRAAVRRRPAGSPRSRTRAPNRDSERTRGKTEPKTAVTSPSRAMTVPTGRAMRLPGRWAPVPGTGDARAGPAARNGGGRQDERTLTGRFAGCAVGRSRAAVRGRPALVRTAPSASSGRPFEYT